MKVTTLKVTKKASVDNLSQVKRYFINSMKAFGNKTKEMVLGEDRSRRWNVVKYLILKEVGLKMSWFLKRKTCWNFSKI